MKKLAKLLAASMVLFSLSVPVPVFADPGQVPSPLRLSSSVYLNSEQVPSPAEEVDMPLSDPGQVPSPNN